MPFTVVIPARYAASRLPGKPLLDIAGKPMLQHVYERACESAAGNVIIATDDQRILQAAQAFGAQACLTSTAHQSGTDRIQEVAAILGLAEDAIVVNVQGDEPLIPPTVINQVAANLSQHPEAGISTLCEQITDPGEVADPNAVKVVMDSNGLALYFSRAGIPYNAGGAGACYRHIGIYGYRVAVLNQFVGWPQAELEIIEKLEQLRALHNGVRIHVAICSERIPPGVDTERDLEAVRSYLAGQKLGAAGRE